MTLAVVLGGGGSAAVAWELGVLLGLAELGFDVPPDSTLVGTSAGAIVSAQLSSGLDVAELYQRVHARAPQPPMDLDFGAVSAGWELAAAGAESALDARRRIGRAAASAQTMPSASRREEIAELMLRTTWPDRALLVTAVSADSGEFRTFTRESGVDFVDAVAASCAVPSVWPTVVIDGERFMDGSVRSPTNTALAAGHRRVLVLAPLLPTLGGGITREVDQLGPDVSVTVLTADDESRAAFGSNPLDPRVGPGSAAMGLRQGRAAAPRARAVLG
jgi:NTE family protein